MKRPIVWALAVALLSPALASAQDPFAPPPTRFTVSPYLGYAFGYTQRGTAHFTSAAGVGAADYERHVDGGMMPGVAVEYRMPGRFGASASFAYNKRGQETVSTDYVDIAPMYSNGSALWLMKAAATMELTDPAQDLALHQVQGQISAGPALIREVPDATTGRPAVNSIGVNVAAAMELPLPWKGFAFRGAFEDYIAGLPLTDVAVQLGTDISGQAGQAISADMSRPTTHLYVVRAGLSYHF